MDLLSSYGTTARHIAEHEGPAPAFIENTTFSEAEIDWIVRNEQVVHLEDILLRRTQIVITGQATRAVVRKTGAIAAIALGWEIDRADAEFERTIIVLTQRHGITFHKDRE